MPRKYDRNPNGFVAAAVDIIEEVRHFSGPVGESVHQFRVDTIRDLGAHEIHCSLRRLRPGRRRLGSRAHHLAAI